MEHTFVKQLRLLWNNIEAIIILLFFATFPFNIRKVFLTKYSYLNGGFNEYLTPSFGWVDLLILLLILIYITKVILCQYCSPKNETSYQYNKKNFLSNILSVPKRALHLFHKTKFTPRSETFLLFLFLLWMALTIFWSPFKLIAIYRLFIILGLLTFFWISLILIKKSFIKADYILLGLVTGGIFQSLIGISQFLLNRSLGLSFLGESILGSDLPSVAKIIVLGVKHIRAYGTFPHPNILAGFLVLQIILIAILFFKRRKNESRLKQNISHETILSRLPNYFFLVAFVINFLCFLLTFSRSAYLSLVIVSLVLLFIKVRRVRSYYWVFPTALIFAALFFGILRVSQKSTNFLLSTQSLQERNPFLEVSREIISAHPVRGTGIGQFVYFEYFKNSSWLGWQYQPVHNFYLLIASELGLVGIILFLALILTHFHNYCNMRITPVLLTYHYYCFIIISFLIISFFDHYFWDIQLGLIIFLIPFFLFHVETADNAL